MKFWWGKNTDQNTSARSLTIDLCSGGIVTVWSTTTRTPVSDATAVTFSVKCFNQLKYFFCQETSSKSGLLHILFIYSRAFNKY